MAGSILCRAWLLRVCWGSVAEILLSTGSSSGTAFTVVIHVLEKPHCEVSSVCLPHCSELSLALFASLCVLCSGFSGSLCLCPGFLWSHPYSVQTLMLSLSGSVTAVFTAWSSGWAVFPCSQIRLPSHLCLCSSLHWGTSGIPSVTHRHGNTALSPEHLILASWFCLNNSDFRQVHFVWDQTICQLFWVGFFLDTDPGNSVLLISHHILPLSKIILPPVFSSFPSQGQISVKALFSLLLTFYS